MAYMRVVHTYYGMRKITEGHLLHEDKEKIVIGSHIDCTVIKKENILEEYKDDCRDSTGCSDSIIRYSIPCER